ncbi:MAG: transcription antitermination factor NusB [Candidatus Methylacidiphilales bacterium]|nr:transcription antitermination factor NusB [Candidatus Methylacidiphilales bacterium]
MGTRRQGRECAVQFLYQFDLNPTEYRVRAWAGFWKMTDATQATRTFAEGLGNGVLDKVAIIDEKIKALADNWDLNRLAVVDRNILRLAIYEMCFREDIPPVVSINEAIEIAKRYSTEDSGKFVNGILDEVKKELLRPARHASSSAPGAAALVSQATRARIPAPPSGQPIGIPAEISEASGGPSPVLPPDFSPGSGSVSSSSSKGTATAGGSREEAP